MRKKTAIIFLAVLLAAAFSPTGLIMHFAPVMAHSGIVLSAWTWNAPTIDGNITEEEWGAAAKVDFNITTPDFVYNGTIYVMNDYENLYLAAKITDDDFGTNESTYDIFAFFFNNDDYGPPSQGDDGLLCCSIIGPPFDLFYYNETVGWPSDDSDGGIIDGEGEASGDGAYNYFEFTHPLDSADDAHDFSLKIGDVVGFIVAYVDNGSSFPVGFWPPLGSPWNDIRIAAPLLQGDLVLSDNDVYTITGEFIINGSIIVTENATLVMRNAVVNFILPSPTAFNMTFKNPLNGSPRLIVENATVNANNTMFVYFYNNSTAQINNLTSSNVRFLFYDTSNATFSVFQGYDLVLYGSSDVQAYSANLFSLALYDTANLTTYDSTATWLYLFGDSTVYAINSTAQNRDINGQAEVHVFFYLDVYVEDLANAPVPNATVNVYLQGSTTPDYSGQTKDDGKARFILKSGVENATDFYPLGFYTIEAVYQSYINSTDVAMDGNKEITVTLDFIIPEAPSLLMVPIYIAASLLALIASRKRRLSIHT